MTKSKRIPKPTFFQAGIIRQIARSPLVKVHSEQEVIWRLRDGREIPKECAAALIRNGWVVPQRDGLSMFDESQTYVALKP